MRGAGWAWIPLALSLAATAGSASAGGASAGRTLADRMSIDRTVARYFALETGDVAHPHFVYERMLAFEARLEVLSQGGADAGDAYLDRDVRSGLDHHIADDILAMLADKLMTDSTADKRPSEAELDGVRETVIAAILESLGGRARVDRAARAEGVSALEVDELLDREAMAAWYLDRAVTPILRPTEDQLRDVYRTSDHPYRGQPFEAVRKKLERWFVVQRLRVAESGFLQAARSRLRIVVTP